MNRTLLRRAGVVTAVAADSEASAPTAPAADTEASPESEDSGGTSVWGIAGTVLGVAALVLALLAYRRANQPSA
ncbi:hypothetical protein [Actinoplanes sp. NBRC 103695]|uniref:hypothetical protein n=1 Tax=Actinoplanes sp. NBRC 103695 TaxID=3032202 RepID=UPI0024A4A8EF|nr:hypothetical protein [Actinoplanes sp. NBRC 103695]GLZ01128.1 hypothetical protein Acsp02_83790 [Actinoplanes sp. NBRC 103695]